MQTCKKCKLDKKLECFTKNTNTWCKPCAKEYAKNWRVKHSERLKVKEKLKYQKNKESIKKRAKAYYASNSEILKLKAKEFRRNNPEYSKNNDAERSRNLKYEVISHYGDRCFCCGEAYMEFLTIDHTNGGGTAHRKEVGYGKKFYNWLKRNGYPEEYRTLCMNCNFSFGLRGYCPHKDGTKFKSIREDL